eukprot:Em0003g61a
MRLAGRYQITGSNGRWRAHIEGSVLVFGWNKDGQLGLGPSDDVTVPRPLALTASITKVACGWNHTLAVTRGGSLLVWGSNSYGQLGISETRHPQPCPVELAHKLFGNSNVRDVAAGLRHSLAVSEDGVVFCWGDGRKGQLGCEREGTSQPQPVSFPLAAKCTRCAAGSYHCAVVSEQGGVFTWGLNQDGQCGVPPGETSPRRDGGRGMVCTPRPLHLPPVEMIRCGWSHTIAIAVGGCVMVWGRCDYGQLGLEPHLLAMEGRCSYLPSELRPLKEARQVSCGSEHNIAMNGSGDVLTWGWNEHGMCGTGHEENVLTPYMLQVPVDKRAETVLVGSGAGHTMLVVRDNQIFE